MMLGIPKLTMDGYINILVETAKTSGATGWKSYLMFGKESKDQVAKVNESITIGQALSTKDKTRIRDLNNEERQRVAVAAKTTTQSVQEFLFQYQATFLMHRFVHTLKTKKLAMPVSQENLQIMMQRTPPKGMREMTRRQMR
jgi:nitric oxide reductase large subunit